MFSINPAPLKHGHLFPLNHLTLNPENPAQRKQKRGAKRLHFFRSIDWQFQADFLMDQWAEQDIGEQCPCCNHAHFHVYPEERDKGTDLTPGLSWWPGFRPWLGDQRGPAGRGARRACWGPQAGGTHSPPHSSSLCGKQNAGWTFTHSFHRHGLKEYTACERAGAHVPTRNWLLPDKECGRPRKPLGTRCAHFPAWHDSALASQQERMRPLQGHVQPRLWVPRSTSRG